jgi:hypothetical protein
MGKKSDSLSAADYILIAVGLLLFLFGAGLDLTVIGLGAGVTADAIGVLFIIAGFHRKILS